MSTPKKKVTTDTTKKPAAVKTAPELPAAKKPEATAKPTTEAVIVTRWDLWGDAPERIVKCIKVEVDGKNNDERKCEAMEKALRGGWSLTDVDAARQARIAVREAIDRLSVDLEYGADNRCKKVVAGDLRRFANALRQVDNYVDSRERFVDEQLEKYGGPGAVFCPVLPDMHKWPIIELSADGEVSIKKDAVIELTDSQKSALKEITAKCVAASKKQK